MPATIVLCWETGVVDVLFVQGASEGAYAFDAKLAASLASRLGANYKVHYPRMPGEEEPDYAVWEAAFSKELAGLGTTALVLVGHSLGASFVLRYVALNDLEPRPLGVFLAAAPFIGQRGWRGAGFSLPTHSERLGQMRLFFFQGGADEVVPAEHVVLFKQTLPLATVKVLPGRDHQLNNDLSEIAAEIRRLKSEA